MYAYFPEKYTIELRLKQIFRLIFKAIFNYQIFTHVHMNNHYGILSMMFSRVIQVKLVYDVMRPIM